MFPHLVLVGARMEIVGRLIGAPVTLSLIERTGTDGTYGRQMSLRRFSTDITDVDALRACAREVHAWRPIDAMIGLTEHALLPTAIVGEELGARVNPADAVALAQDKAGMRKRLAERGLDTTRHRVCASPEQVRAFLNECRGGVILKPADGNGGRGISLVLGTDEVGAAWAHTAAESRAGGVLAEEYLRGREISVETMSAAGEHRLLALTAKHKTDAPHFVEIAHELPGDIPDVESKAAVVAVLASLDAIGHVWGPCHTEVIVDGGRATIVEINIRFGGARIWEMLEIIYGVSISWDSAMALAYGQLPEPLPVPRGAAAVRFLTPEPGRLIGITGLAGALAAKGVLRIGEMSKVGDVVAPLADFRGRAGYVLAAGSDAGSAADAASHAASLVTMQTVPTTSSGKDTSMSEDLRQALSEVLPSVRRDLDELIKIPSVSADRAHDADTRRTAELTAELLRGAGAPEVEILDGIDGGQPAVLARYPAPMDMPTVLLYAHHDVQPTGDEALWESAPFEPTVRDGRLHARGSSDDKAGIAAHLAALRVFNGNPPVGVTVFVEGEEEIGSPTLGPMLERHRDKLKADVIVLADSANLEVGAPAFTTTLRGMCDCVVEVRALEHALHSGMFGGATPDALTALCRLLATLHDDKGNVAIEGLVTAPAPETEYPEERFRAEAGLLDGVQLIGTGSIAERVWSRPACTVLAIDATSVANASNTLAKSARAKISLRLAPGENAAEGREKLVRHLHENAPWGVQIEVTGGKAGSPYTIAAEGPAFDAARAAYGAAYGKDVVNVGIGGTIPFIAAFADAFPDAAILVTSAGMDPDSRAHGANESLDLGDFENACLSEILLLTELAARNDAGKRARVI